MKKAVLIILTGIILMSSNVYAQQADTYDILLVPNDIVFSYTGPLAGDVTFRGSGGQIF